MEEAPPPGPPGPPGADGFAPGEDAAARGGAGARAGTPSGGEPLRRRPGPARPAPGRETPEGRRGPAAARGRLCFEVGSRVRARADETGARSFRDSAAAVLGLPPPAPCLLASPQSPRPGARRPGFHLSSAVPRPGSPPHNAFFFFS